MKYTKEQRLDIGRQIYSGEITRYKASERYGISVNTARDYMRLYRDLNQLPPKQSRQVKDVISSLQALPAGMDDLSAMTKEELIREVIKARIQEARLKKGYEVKGDGTVIVYDKKNTK